MTLCKQAWFVLVLGLGCSKSSAPDDTVGTEAVLRELEEEMRREMEEPELSKEDLELLEELNAHSAGKLERDVATTVSVPGCTFGIETRDHHLWLHIGADPQVYTVTSKDGKVLASSIDDARLERDYPELHDMLHDGPGLIDVIDY